MSNSPVTRTVEVRNSQGLHARPASLFVELAKKFKSKVYLTKEGQRVEANQIFMLLTLNAQQGTKVTIEAEGDDAEQAANELARLVEEGFAGDDEANHEHHDASEDK